MIINNYIIIIIFLLCLIIYLIIYKNYKNTFNKPLDILIFKKDFLEIKYNQLYKYFGKYKFITKNTSNQVSNIIWTDDIDKNFFILGKYNGFDYIELTSNIYKSHHPQILKMFIIIGKYIYIPKQLHNIILNISSTINIDQINIPIKYNQLYVKKGTNYITLLKIYCSHITIAAITIKFIQDIINLYKTNKNISKKIILKINDEYNHRILNFINNNEITPDIPWFDRYSFGE